MKKILQINVSVNDGSNGTIAENIGNVFLNHGWDSYIAYGRKALASKSKLIHIGNKFDVFVHGVQSRMFDNHGLASIIITKRFIKQIDQIKPDVIHLHNIHGYYMNYKILFKYLVKNNIPVIWTMHDCWALTGHCSHFVSANCNKWKIGCYECPLIKSYPKAYIDKSQRNYKLKKFLFTSVPNMIIIPVSQWLGDIIKESYMGKYPIKVIHNGVDVNIFKPMSLNDIEMVRNKYNLCTNKKIILGVASTWTKGKGLHDFYKLGDLLPSDYQIVLVGVSKMQLDKLPKHINGILRTDNVQELATLYTMALVFVNPTWADTFPTTNLEAMACGTPVVTYKTGGSVEPIIDVTGYVVEQGDIDNIVESIKKISTSNINYKYTCRNHIINNFEKYTCFNQYYDLYQSLLNIK